jgi:hypothetical protein
MKANVERIAKLMADRALKQEEAAAKADAADKAKEYARATQAAADNKRGLANLKDQLKYYKSLETRPKNDADAARIAKKIAEINT